MSLKVLSLNIEGQKHLERVRGFLASEKADVVCLMEVYQSNVESLVGAEYRDWVYAPNNVVQQESATRKRETMGVMIMSKQMFDRQTIKYFDGKTPGTVAMIGTGTHSPVMVVVELGKYRLGAVHFTWTPAASETQKQNEHLDNLLDELAGVEMVMCGDFNIPRGNELYEKLSARYHDNVPAEVESTIDPVLHYANQKHPGKLKLVVDYAWSTPGYLVEKVRVETGISDHCGLVCLVSRV